MSLMSIEDVKNKLVDIAEQIKKYDIPIINKEQQTQTLILTIEEIKKLKRVSSTSNIIANYQSFINNIENETNSLLDNIVNENKQSRKLTINKIKKNITIMNGNDNTHMTISEYNELINELLLCYTYNTQINEIHSSLNFNSIANDELYELKLNEETLIDVHEKMLHNITICKQREDIQKKINMLRAGKIVDLQNRDEILIKTYNTLIQKQQDKKRLEFQIQELYGVLDSNIKNYIDSFTNEYYNEIALIMNGLIDEKICTFEEYKKK